jgi:hypothetical protein
MSIAKGPVVVGINQRCQKVDPPGGGRPVPNPIHGLMCETSRRARPLRPARTRNHDSIDIGPVYETGTDRDGNPDIVFQGFTSLAPALGISADRRTTEHGKRAGLVMKSLGWTCKKAGINGVSMRASSGRSTNIIVRPQNLPGLPTNANRLAMVACRGGAPAVSCCDVFKRFLPSRSRINALAEVRFGARIGPRPSVAPCPKTFTLSDDVCNPWISGQFREKHSRLSDPKFAIECCRWVTVFRVKWEYYLTEIRWSRDD